MRALVILVLAGALLWLALQGFRSVRAEKESPPEAPRAGFILPPRDPEPTTTPASPAARTSTDGPGLEEKGRQDVPHSSSSMPQAPVETPAPKPPPEPKPDPEKKDPHASPSPDEFGAAELILQSPREIPAFLEGPGSSLPPGRKQLALALHHLVQGSEAPARRILDALEVGGNVRVEEIEFLRAALNTSAPRPAAASVDGSPMVLAATLARLARAADEHLAAGRNREAALSYGELLVRVLDAPWKTGRESLQAWSDGLARAQRGYRWNPSGDWASIAVQVQPGDSLISVRKRALDAHPDLLVCTGEIARANGLQGETIHPGDTLRIPTAHPNVLVDLDSHWALYRMDAEVVAAWEIGIGKPGTETPPGEYRTGEKSKEPMWFRAGHPPVPFGDPENPLGTRWIAWQLLDGKNSSLGFHGTRDPGSIGDDQSQGCVRMRKEAIEELYEILPRGAVIRVRG